MKRVFKTKYFSFAYLAIFSLVAATLLMGSSAFAIEKFVDDQVYGMYEKRGMGKKPVYGGTYRTSFYPPPRSFDPPSSRQS